jgi:hypothetical protein
MMDRSPPYPRVSDVDMVPRNSSIVASAVPAAPAPESRRVTELKQIVDKHREPLRRFAAQIQELAPTNALGWTVYAAMAPAGNDSPRRAVHSVLMFETVDLELVRRLGALGRHYGRDALAAPLIMTPEFLHASLDTFPLELIEIQQAYSVVFGPDYFGALQFEHRDVRLQCERELDVLLIGLQQGLLAVGGIEDRLTLLQHDWLRSLLRALRGMLWLKGQRERLSADRVVADVSRLVELPLEGIRRALSAPASTGWEAFQRLHADVKALGTAVDGW